MDAVAGRETEIPSYYFYDLNARVTARSDPRTTDDLGIPGPRRPPSRLDVGSYVDIRWGIWPARRVGPACSIRASPEAPGLASEYRSDTNVQVFSTPLRFTNRLLDVTSRDDLDWRPRPDHRVGAGASFSTYRVTLTQEFNKAPQPGRDERPRAAAAYVEDRWSLSPLWTVRPGLRAELFGSPGRLALEPRFSAGRVVSPTLRLTAGGGGYTQHPARHDGRVQRRRFLGAHRPIGATRPLMAARGWRGVGALRHVHALRGGVSHMAPEPGPDRQRPHSGRGRDDDRGCLLHRRERMGVGPGAVRAAPERRPDRLARVHAGMEPPPLAGIERRAAFPPKYTAPRRKVVAQWDRSAGALGPTSYSARARRSRRPRAATTARPRPRQQQRFHTAGPGTRRDPSITASI